MLSESEEYKDSDNEEEQEQQLDLFRETFKEKAWAFRHQDEIISLKGAKFKVKTRVPLALVPGLLGKVSLVCIL